MRSPSSDPEQPAVITALAVRAVVLAVAFLVVDATMDTVTVSGGFFGALGVAIVFGLLSAVLGTVLRLLTLPLVLLTVGLLAETVGSIAWAETDSSSALVIRAALDFNWL